MSSTPGITVPAGTLGTSRRRLLRRPGRPALTRWATPLALLALWQLLSATGVLAEHTLASPTTIATTTWDLIDDGTLPQALWVSLRRALLGLLLGSAVAVAAATVSGLSRTGEALVDPTLQMIRTIPLFGLVPLFILWFGIGELPKILLVALGVVIPLYLNLHAAFRAIDPELTEVATTLKLTRAERWRHLIVPTVLPGALVGFRQSLGIAWLSLIVGEQIAADAGLGYMINNARDFLQTDVIVVGLLAYAVLGLVTDAIVRVAERRALRYREKPGRA